MWRNTFGKHTKIIQFGKHTKIIQKLDAWDALPKLTTNVQSNYNLNQFANSLINCEEIHIKSYQIGLKRIKLENLKVITLNRLYLTTKIKSISNYAFYDCDSIEEIDIEWQ